MKPINSVFCLGLFWLVMALGVRADDQSNPFQSITDRNVFALKPPPPPPSNDPAPAPPPQLAKVVLTGITSMFGPSSKRALLEIEETEPGKQKSVKKPILQEGQRYGSIEVVTIDLDTGVVKIRNNGFETNLTFAELKSVAAAPAPGVGPGAMPMPGRVGVPGAFPGIPQIPGMNIPANPANSSSPIIIPRRGMGSDQPSDVNPAGPTATGFNPATTPGAPTGYRSYPGAYRGGIVPSAVPLPPGYQK